MNLARVLALSRLRLRLNANYVAAQLVLDVGMPVAYALAAAVSLPGSDAARLSLAALLLTATLSLLRIPASTFLYERLTGGTNLLLAAGVSKVEFAASNAVSAIYFSIFPIISYLICSVLLNVNSTLGGIVVLSVMSYAVTLHGASIFVSSIFNRPGGLALATNLIVLTTAAICPLYFLPERVPLLLRPIVEVLPASLAMAAYDAAGPSSFIATPQLGLLWIWAMIAIAAGYFTAFRRNI